MNDLQAQMAKCFAAVFPNMDNAQIPSASLTSVAEWDSLATINLVSVIEEEFEIQIPIQDLEQLISFEHMLAYVKTRQTES